MVYQNLPQRGGRSIDSNTNYSPEGEPPVSGIIPPAFINMLFETGETMLYEDNSFSMAYEAANDVPADWFNTAFKHRLPL